jgi:hypothetical protein
MISFLDDLTLFLGGLWFLVYLPGRWWTEKLKFPAFDRFLTALIFGLVQFTLGQFFLGLAGLRVFAYLISAGLAILSLVKQRLRFKSLLSDWGFSWKTWLILGLGIAAQSSLVWRSGLVRNDGSVQFTEYRDALWHLALIEELASRIPPLHPGFAGVDLTHYHFLTDLFFGSLLKVLPLDPLDFFFRVMPLLLSCLFGLVLLSLAKNFLKGRENLLLVFGYFTGSLAWALPIFFPGMAWQESSFWVSQTFSMLINPPLALSLAILAFSGVLLSYLTKDWQFRLELIVAILAGSLVGFKVYSGILIALGLLGFGFACLLAGEKKVARMGALTFLVASAVFFPTNKLASSTQFLIWSPGWFLRALVENPDRVYLPKLVLAEQALRAGGSWFRLTGLYLFELALFIVGNFGVRMIGLLGLKQAWQSWGKSLFSFWLMILISGVIFPLLFIQKGSVANTIQTFYYSLLVADLFLMMILAGLLRHLKPRTGLVVLSMILLAALPTSVRLFRRAVAAEPQVVSAEEMAGYRFLRELPRHLVLVPPTVRHLDALWVGALANKRVVYSDKLMAENTHQTFEKRYQEVKAFFSDGNAEEQIAFLKRHRVAFIVLAGREMETFSLEGLDLDKIFTNKDISIFKVKD